MAQRCALVLLVSQLFLLFACSPATESPVTAAPQSIYRHAMDGAPSSLDPAQASHLYANFMAVNLYDTLYRYQYLARQYQLAPNVAESLTQISEDGLIYTIRI